MKDLLLSLEAKYLEKNDPDARRRLKHSQLVAKKMLELAQIHKIEICKETILITGLIHDYAKFIRKEEYLLLQDKYPEIKNEINFPSPIWHAILGPYIIQEELNIYNQEILEAVKYHTTAFKDMTCLTKLLFVADFIEDSRRGEEVLIVRSLAKESINRAVAKIIEYKILYLKQRKRKVHPFTIDALEYYKEYL